MPPLCRAVVYLKPTWTECIVVFIGLQWARVAVAMSTCLHWQFSGYLAAVLRCGQSAAAVVAIKSAGNRAASIALYYRSSSIDAERRAINGESSRRLKRMPPRLLYILLCVRVVLKRFVTSFWKCHRYVCNLLEPLLSQQLAHFYYVFHSLWQTDPFNAIALVWLEAWRKSSFKFLRVFFSCNFFMKACWYISAFWLKNTGE